MVPIMKVTVIWIVLPHNVVFTSVVEELTTSIFSVKWYSFTLYIKAVSSFNTLVNFYKTTWYHIPRRHYFLYNYKCVCPNEKRRAVWHHIFCQRILHYYKNFIHRYFGRAIFFEKTNNNIRISTVLHQFGLMHLFHVPRTTSRTVHQWMSWIIQRQGIQNGNTRRIFWKLFPQKFMDVAAMSNVCVQLEWQYFEVKTTKVTCHIIFFMKSFQVCSHLVYG